MKPLRWALAAVAVGVFLAALFLRTRAKDPSPAVPARPPEARSEAPAVPGDVPPALPRTIPPLVETDAPLLPGTPRPGPAASPLRFEAQARGLGRGLVRRRPDGVLVADRSWGGVSWDTDGTEIRFAPAHRPLRLDLQRSTLGGVDLLGETRPAPELDDSGRAVLYRHGALVERLQVLSVGLEQSFEVAALPRRPGAWEVAVGVRTELPPPAGSARGPQVDLGGGVLASQAVVIDGAGRRLDLEMAYAAGTLRLSVPAEWMASATAPVVLDPLISGPQVVGGSGGDSGPGARRVADAAFNPAAQEWLVVWQEDPADLYARRLDAQGLPLGPVLPLAASAAAESEPVVSWNPDLNQYLVAWTQTGAESFIGGRLVAADGSYPGEPFVIDDRPGSDSGPGLATGPGRWLCVYTNRNGQADVWGRFVGPDGVPGAAVAIDVDADEGATPSVALLDGTWYVVWTKGAPRSIVAASLDASGILSPRVTVDRTSLDCVHPDLAAGAGSLFVVWQQEVGPADHNIVGRPMGPALTFPINPFSIRSTTYDQLSPRVEYVPANDEWFVVYADSVSGAGDIYGRRVTSAGAIAGIHRLSSDLEPEARPEAAVHPTANRLLVVYRLGSAPAQTVSQLVDLDFFPPTVPGPPRLSADSSATGQVRITWPPSQEIGTSGFLTYELQRSANGGASWSIAGSPAAPAFDDVLAHGEYLYRVRAKDVAGNRSAYSALSAVLVVDPAQPAEPVLLRQLRADGTTPLASGGTLTDPAFVVQARADDPGVFDGFEDGNLTLEPMWTTTLGTWGLGKDGFRYLRDGPDLDDALEAPSSQAEGAWEYRFRFPSLPSGRNLQAQFVLFTDAARNGYQVRVSAGTLSPQSIALERLDAGTPVALAGGAGTWTPDTAQHLLAIRRLSDGAWSVTLDDVVLVRVVDAVHAAATKTGFRHSTNLDNRLRVDHVRMSSAPTARSAVRLECELKPVGTAFDGTGLVQGPLTASGTTASVTLPAPPPGAYRWRVRTVDALGNAGPYSVAGGDPDFTVPSAPPVAPSGLVGWAQPGGASLMWNAVPGASGYQVRRSTVLGGPYTTVAETAGSSFDETGLANLTPIYYVVAALAGSLEGPVSNEVKVVPGKVPDPPTLTATPAGTNSIRWEWNDVGNVAYYELLDEGWDPLRRFPPGTTSFEETGLLENEYYGRSIQAVNGVGEEYSWEVWTATKIRSPLLENFTATATSVTSVRIVILPPAGVRTSGNRFTIDRSLDGVAWSVAGTIIYTSTFDDVGLVAGGEYFYRIRWTNTEWVYADEASPARRVSLVAPLSAPTLGAVVRGPDRIEWSWTATESFPELLLHDAAHAVVAVRPLAEGTYLETGLSPNTLYGRHAYLGNGGLAGPASPAVSAWTHLAAPTAASWTVLYQPGVGVQINVIPPTNFALGSTGAEVTRSEDGFSWAEALPFGGNYSALDTDLADGRTYHYRLRFRNAEGVLTDYAPIRSVGILLAPGIHPRAPGRTRALAPRFTGSGAPGTTIRLYANGVFVGEGPCSDGSWSIGAQGLVDGSFAITATARIGPGGESPHSPPQPLQIDRTPPDAPPDVRTTPYATAIDLEWAPSTASDVAGYRVYRRIRSEDPWELLNPTGLVRGTKYRDAGLSSGVTYRYRVLAVDDARAD